MRPDNNVFRTKMQEHMHHTYLFKYNKNTKTKLYKNNIHNKKIIYMYICIENVCIIVMNTN